MRSVDKTCFTCKIKEISTNQSVHVSLWFAENHRLEVKTGPERWKKLFSSQIQKQKSCRLIICSREPSQCHNMLNWPHIFPAKHSEGGPVFAALRSSHEGTAWNPRDQREGPPSSTVPVELLASLQHTPMSSRPLMLLWKLYRMFLCAMTRLSLRSKTAQESQRSTCWEHGLVREVRWRQDTFGSTRNTQRPTF